MLVVEVYVDDIMITGTSVLETNAFKTQMNKESEMSDMGLLSYYLGIEVMQSNERLRE